MCSLIYQVGKPCIGVNSAEDLESIASGPESVCNAGGGGGSSLSTETRYYYTQGCVGLLKLLHV